MLAEQGRVTEIPNGHDRIAAIARDYAAQPENTIIVSPTIGVANRSMRRFAPSYGRAEQLPRTARCFVP